MERLMLQDLRPLKDEEVGTIVYYGCRQGYSLRCLVDHFEGSVAIGVDPKARIIQEVLGDDTAFCLGGMYDKNISEGSADVSVVACVPKVIGNFDALFREIKRVLFLKGVAILLCSKEREDNARESAYLNGFRVVSQG